MGAVARRSASCNVLFVFESRVSYQREMMNTNPKKLLFLLVSFFAMADSDEASSTHSIASSIPSSCPAVHIVYTETPPDEDPKHFHIRTLASALGSEEAAKDALVYSYKTAVSGFSAKLTPDQVSRVSQQPGVLQVVQDSQVGLHR